MTKTNEGKHRSESIHKEQNEVLQCLKLLNEILLYDSHNREKIITMNVDLRPIHSMLSRAIFNKFRFHNRL